jgi:hypothetical protein
MTALELAELLMHNIDQGNIDADQEVQLTLGAYCRELTSVWVDPSNILHAGAQLPNTNLMKILDHPPEEL